MVFSRSFDKKCLDIALSVILMVSFFSVPLFALMPEARAAPSDWWNLDWAYRKSVTLNHANVGSTLTNFPVLIDIVDANLKASAQSDGDDIVFVDAARTKLNHEIELFDSGTGHLVAWVSVPSVSSTVDTVLYMYYGNGASGNQQNPTGVWDSNSVLVQHLNEESGSTCYDSTSRNNYGTVNGNVVLGSAGKMDGAYGFDGATGFVQVPHSSSLTGFTSGFTASFWLRFDDVTKRQSILQKYDTTGNQKGWMVDYRVDGGRALGLLVSSDGVSYEWWDTPFNPTAGVWYYVTVVWQANLVPKFYVNGAQVSTRRTGTIASVYNNVGAPLHIGRSTYTSDRFLRGSLDEICISNQARPASYILTCYNNQMNPSVFYTVGSEENRGTEKLTLSNPYPSNGATNVYTNPELSINVVTTAGRPITITFNTNASGSWTEIKRYSDVVGGTYSCIPTEMKNLGAKYYWSVNATDGIIEASGLYSFTTTTTILTPKWTRTGLGQGESGVLIADVNGDGLEEVIRAGAAWIRVLNGRDGSVLWQRSDSSLPTMAKPQMADLNKDGILEIIVNIAHGVMAFHANDGSVYWKRNDLSGGNHWSSPVVGDIDGNGYPTVFVASEDITNGANGQGRVTSLSYDGQILHQTFAWRPCFGGLSLADADNDGEFELFMGDRSNNYGDGNYGRGVRCFWAKNLTVKWERPEVLCSSHIPLLADVNKDGRLEVLAGQNAPLYVLDSRDGSIIRYSSSSDTFPIHFQPSICDIDLDGNLEILMADPHDGTTDDVVIWDLYQWKLDGRIYVGKCYYGPKAADVTGDGIMELIACSFAGVHVFNSTYNLLAQATNLGGLPDYDRRLTYAIVQDIDGDGYSELVVSSFNGNVFAFDTPARRANPRPRSEVQHYSEQRLGAAEYVPFHSSLAPVVSDPIPLDGATDVPVALSALSFTLKDFQGNLMNYTVTTNPDVGSSYKLNVPGATYTVPVGSLEPATTYTWKVNVTDGTSWTNKTFTFTTESSMPWWNTGWPYRKTIAIDPTEVSADQTDFPLLLDIIDSDISKAQMDGDDFVFTDASHTKLSHEIEAYDGTTGHLTAWIKVPFVSSTEFTVLYMYYGNPTASNQEDQTAVWDTSYKLVLHLSETHECRMWGMIANTLPHDVVLDNLISAPSSLKVLGGSNRDGWGLVYYAGTAPVVARGPLPASTDPNFDIAANALADSNAWVGVGHVRARSQGGLPPWGDPHPFMRYKGGKWWALAHNGNLNKAILRNLIGPAYLAANPPTYGANWNDDANIVDSDLYSLWVLKCIEANNWDVTLGVAQAIKEMTDAGDSGAANFLLTNGETLWGFRRGNTLYYYYQATSPQYSTIASQPPDTSLPGWVQLNDYNFITVTKNSPPSIITDIRQQYPTPILVDSELSNSVDSADLRLNGTGQDWYESRNNVPALLFLDTNDVGGDTSKKAGFTASSSGNAYLTQEFSTPQTGTFSVQWDIYVDSILDISSPDRAGWMLIGDDFDGLSGPNQPANERFVYLAFYKNGGGTSGTMDLVAKNSTDAFTAHTIISSGLNLKQWYTIRVICNMVAKTYDVYVDGVFKATVKSTFARTSVTHISFAQWNDGAGAFYVDNVYAPARNRYKLAIDTTGSGSVARNPGEASYLPATSVALTATPATGWLFSGWSGDLSGSTNPTTITMDTNKVVGAIFTSQGYTLTITIVGSGSVSKDPDLPTYLSGTVVTLTATPQVGWSFSGWSGDLSGSTNPTTITMDADRSVIATFTQNQYTLTVNTVGSGSISKNPDKPTYIYGEIVTLTASSEPGWAFSSWSGDLSGSTNPTTITMDGNKVVAATFIQGYTLTVNVVGSGSVVRSPDQAAYEEGSVVTLTATPSIGWSFSGWSGELSGNDNPATITMTADKSATATFTQNQYTLTVTIVGGGSVTKSPDQATYTYGDVVTLTATPAPDCSFSDWSGDLTGSVNPITITMDSNKEVTATFIPLYALTVSIVGSGSVTKSPDQAAYEEGSVVTLTATPSIGWSFSGWSGDLTGSTNPTTIIIDANKVVTATFTANPYTLTVNVVGSGSVTKNPDKPTYIYGETVTLTPSPVAGWSFFRWSGDMLGRANPATIMIDGNKAVTATFVQGILCFDSTTNGNTGILHGDVTQGAIGQIDGAYAFDGVNDYIEVPHSSVLSGYAEALTLSFWLRLDDTTRRQVILNKHNTVGNQRSWYIEFQTSSTLGKVFAFYASPDGSSQRDWYARFTPVSGTWYYVALVWETGKVPRFYINGVQLATIGTSTISQIYNNPGAPLHIGRSTYASDRYLRGSLDEIRISNPARSLQYIMTCYNNQKDPSSFYDIGTEESLPQAPMISDPHPENGATNVPISLTELSFNLTDYQYDLMDYSVTTDPDIGGNSATGVGDGTYSVAVSGLQYSTTYTWHVQATDGIHITDATYTFTTASRWLVDSELSDSSDSADLIANSPSQDWYESRNDLPTLLFLDTNNVGSDTSKKAGFTANSGRNAYLTQEFSAPQTGTFSAQWDIYVDSILDISSPDRAGIMLIGSDLDGQKGPSSTDSERFVFLAFFKNGGGTSGTMDLVSMSSFSAFTTVASGLSMKKWYTIKVIVNVPAGTYDIYVDGVFKATKNACKALTSITHISFAQWNDGAGAFYVDNVFSPAVDRYKLTVSTVGSGSVTANPVEATYAAGSGVTLTANPATGWTFSGWSGDLSGNTNPAVITMTANKGITATFTQDQYTLTATTVGNGQVSKNPELPTYTYSTVVTLTATADPGWTFSSWSGDLSGNTNPTTITMDGNKAATATFTEIPIQYTLTITIDGLGSVDPSGGVYDPGAVVTLTATADPGWSFSGWSGDLSGSVSPVDLTMDGDKSVTATFTQNVYTLTVTVVGSGSVSTSPNPPYYYGNVVTLTATPQAGWLFSQWSGALTGSTNPTTITMDGNKVVTATFIHLLVDSELSDSVDSADLRANGAGQDWYESRAQTPSLLTLDTSGVGGNLGKKARLSGTSLSTDNAYLTQDFITAQTGTFSVQWDIYVDSIVDLAGTTPDRSGIMMIGTSNANGPNRADAVRFVFLAFYKNGGGTSGTADLAAMSAFGTFTTVASGLNLDQWYTIRVVVNFAAKTYEVYVDGVYKGSYAAVTAWTGSAITHISFAQWNDGAGTFYVDNVHSPALDRYKLTVNTVGSGSVTKTPGESTYAAGSVVTLTATPASGWAFSAWSGGLSGSVSPATVTMDSDKTITATFTQNQYTLTVNVAGSGSVTKSPDKTTYNDGEIVTLEAVPSDGWSFTEWSGDLSGNTNPTTITMTGNKVVTATFTQLEYALTVTVAPPEGGSVTISSLGPYHYGDTVQLTAVPTTDWSFSGWDGDLIGSDNPATITITGNTAITAYFSQNERTLTINIVGNGQVSKEPNKATYPDGTVVTLTATADPGWTFAGWSIDLTGNDNPATITMDANKAVTATFTENQYTLDVTIVGNGQVSKNPNLATYTYGTVVTLTATADLGWSFNGWSGDLSGSSNPATITMDANKAVTATFTQNQYTLTVDTVGSGSVAKNPEQPTYTYNTIVTLTATPQAGWLFSQWTGDLTGSTNPATVTITGNKVVTATFIRLLVDSEFSDSVDNATLRANGAGQDWYESRGQNASLLTLDTADVGGNSGKKARLTGGTNSATDNIYLTQEFISPQTGVFSVQWDIYVDQILDISGTDRTGWMLIGDDSTSGNGPNAANGERFVYMAFFKNGGGTSGTMDLVAVNRTGSFTNHYIIASGLNLKQWYTIKVVCDIPAGTYDVYVDGILQKAGVSSRNAKTNVTHISFAQWNDGAGTFYVDNVFSPAVDRYKLTVSTVGSGSVAWNPMEATYAAGSTVTLTATPQADWSFSGWSGDLSGINNPESITIDANKAVTATFTQLVNYNDVVFDSSFETGNLKNVQFQSGDSLGNRFYTGEQDHTTVSGMTDKHWWFYFSMDNVAGKTVTIKLVNNEVADMADRWAEIEPVYSFNNVNWERLSLSNVLVDIPTCTFQMTVTLTPSQNKIWLAPLPPYTISLRDALFTEFASSPYLTVSSLGITPGGQELKVATITDNAYSDANKIKAYVIAMQHSTEVPGGWEADGMVRFLLSDDPTARAIRRSYIFRIVPIVNVDGVFYGRSRYTPLRDGVQYDLNRWWSYDVSAMPFEVAKIFTDIQAFQPSSFNDIHSTINIEMGSPKDAVTYTWDATNPTVAAFLNKIHDAGWPDTQRGYSGYACTQVHSRLGVVRSISWENPQDEFITNLGHKLTVSDWRDMGKAYAKGVYLDGGDAQATLTTNVVGSGSITKNPDQATYAYGTSVQLTAVPAAGWSFSVWSEDLTGSTNPTTIIMTGNKAVTATFTQLEYTLTVTVSPLEGGSVSLSPTGPYHYGDMVQLTVVPAAGWVFFGWSGDLTGSVSPATITIDGDKAVTATFTETPQNEYTLTVNVVGSGTVTKNPDQATYVDGTTVTLTASASTGYTFSGWSGALSGSQSPADLVMDGNKVVTATFTPNQYTLTLTTVGSGSVSKNPDQATYTYGTVVELAATAGLGWSFSGWSGDLTGSDNPATITITGNTAVTATFTQDQYTLTVNIVGSGSYVKDPDQTTYTYGAVVQLSATPASGWMFSGWSGDLSGSTNPAAITMDKSKTVTATFLQILLTDSSFDDSVDNATLRANGAGQDWYESRGQNASLLTLDTADVGGNSGKKARLTGGTNSATDNIYLTQEFISPQTGVFSVQWDIYIDQILDISSPDRSGWMLIGDDSVLGSGPNAANGERFVYMAFFKNGGGTTGTMDLVAVNRTGSFSSHMIVASGLSLKQWYTIRVIVNVLGGTYDVYVDGVFKATVTSRNAKTSVTHISFAQWNDGAGTFYVDNVFSPALEGSTVSLSMADPMGAAYRWMDVADQAYSSSYQSTYQYSQGTVNVIYNKAGKTLFGKLVTKNLKPNFAYQLKLVGTPGTADNELMGLAGRWWEEEWDGTAWANGQNLNDKGTGSSPNPNDDTYSARKSITDITSPTGLHYRYTGYLLFGYFITDGNGNANLYFETGSCYHVLWKTTQRARVAEDGPLKTVTFDPVLSAAYDVDYPSSTISIFGEWERLPMGTVNLATGNYNCHIVLTEESFHGTGPLEGNWAAAMSTTIAFSIAP